MDSIGPDQQVSVNLARVRERDRDAARRLANTRNLRVAAYLRVTSVPQSAQELWTVHDCGRTSETRLERLRRDRRQWVPSIIEDAAARIGDGDLVYQLHEPHVLERGSHLTRRVLFFENRDLEPVPSQRDCGTESPDAGACNQNPGPSLAHGLPVS